MRAALACLAAGALGLVVLGVMAAAGAGVLPAFLAAWLFGLGVPLGALALLLGMEALGLGALPLAAALRPLLLALPALALLSAPLLLGWGHLGAGHARSGFAAGWYATPLVVAREAAFLVVWLLLALLVARPGRARGVAAGLLLLHLLMLTVAATDWLGVAEPGLDPSLLGVLLLLAQCGTALSVALLLPGGLPPRRHGVRTGGVPAGAVALLLGLLAGWAFVQFVQFLVVWSADLPKEVTWYLRRGTGLGLVAQWLGLLVLLLALGLLVPTGPGGRARVVAGVAALVLLLHGVEALWLVVPTYRGGVTVSAGDVVALLCVAGLGLGCVLLGGARAGGGRLAS